MTEIGTYQDDIVRSTTHDIWLPGKISYQEFLGKFDGVHAEWVDGEVLLPMAANYQHQKLSKLLTTIMTVFALLYDLGEVIQPPFQMKISAKRGREPDVMFLAKANLHKLRNSYIDGAADLAIEIVSPESGERDAVTKLAEYESGGAPEFWIIDQEQRQAIFYQLNADSHYAIITPDEQNRYYSRSLTGFWLQVDWLWRDPLPTAEKVLMRIAGADYDAYLANLRQTDDI